MVGLEDPIPLYMFSIYIMKGLELTKRRMGDLSFMSQNLTATSRSMIRSGASKEVMRPLPHRTAVSIGLGDIYL